MTPRVRKILVAVAYGSFYWVMVVLFFFWTFPYERLKTRLVHDFNARQTEPDAMRLEVDSISSYWLSGVEAEGMRLISPPPPEAVGKAAKPKITTIEQAHARLSLFALLAGKRVVSFGAKAFGGNLDGSITDSDAERVLEVEVEGLDLGQTPLLAGLIGLPVSGQLSGTANLITPEARLSKAEGKMSFKLAGLSVGDGKAKIRDIIALPKLDAGELGLEAEVKSGQMTLSQLSAHGPDLELNAQGTIRLRDQPGQSLLSLQAEFKFTDHYTNKDDMTKALFGPSGAFDLDPKNRRAKRSDGFYAWRVSGALSSPSFMPSGSALSTKHGAAHGPKAGAAAPE
ncbi:MAG TPA: type II secretion system protein GspN [Polyangiaceae bacterium]|nr:type II secretion system protein GspN [Polyangiaceae bacterium]